MASSLKDIIKNSRQAQKEAQEKKGGKQTKINYFVTQGTYALMSDTSFNFGTDGLGTCLGIIIEYSHGINFCGHLSFDQEPQNQNEKEIFSEKVQTLFSTLTLTNNAERVYYCTSSGLYSAIESIRILKQIFQNKLRETQGEAHTNRISTCLFLSAPGVIHICNEGKEQGVTVYTNEFKIGSLYIAAAASSTHEVNK